MFALVTRQRRGRIERGVRLLVAAELVEEVAANARQQVIAFERRLARKVVYDRRATSGPSAMPTATARLRLMIGERTTAASSA